MVQIKEKLATKEKIAHILEETRVVLPGTQALLGFQFVAIFSADFGKLPFALQLLHLLSLGCIAISTMFLMATVAYHRIVERGEDTERFHQFASTMALAAMVALALGMATDIYLVVQKVVGSTMVSSLTALTTLGLFYFFWFGYTAIIRKKQA